MTGHYLLRPATAFSTPRQKRPRVESKSHLSFIRGLCCVICGARNPDPAHLRSPNPKYGKKPPGMGEKPDDRWVNPLCRGHHDEQHAGEELAFWQRYGIDPFALAMSLYGVSGDDEAAAEILREHAPRATP